MIFNKKLKLFFIFLIFALLIIVFERLAEYLYFEKESNKITLHNGIEKSLEREQVLKTFINHSSTDLKAIRELDMFNRYLNGNYSPKELQKIFLSFSMAHPAFMQLRYIDKNGLEKIRVDRDKEAGEVYLVPEDKLQNKSNRYYFADSRSKPLEKVWFSALDLNIERGKVEIPQRPTLRAVLPIKHNDQFNGILIINYFMESMLDKMLYATLYDMILCDGKGYILKHYNSDKDWGFYNKKQQFNISNEFPENYKDILNNRVFETENFVSRKLDVDIQGDLYLVLKLSKSYLKQHEQNILAGHIGNSIIIVLFSIVLSLFVIKYYSRTLLNLDEIQKLYGRLSTASKVAKIGFYEIDRNTDKIIWSDELYDIFELGDKNTGITYKSFLSFVTEEYKEKVQKSIIFSTPEHKGYFVTYKIKTAKGNIKYLEERGRHYYGQNNQVIKSIGSIYDVTYIKLSQKKYLQQASYTSKILNSQKNFILLVKGERSTDANSAMLEFFGCSTLEQFKKKHKCICELFIEGEGFLSKIQKKKKWIEILKENPDRNFNVKINDLKGQTRIFCVDISKEPVQNDEYVINFTDITELYGLKNDLEEEVKRQTQINLRQEILLFEQSKMAEMGAMIGNIAHQWKQPLNVISTLASAIQFRNQMGLSLEKEDIEEDMEQILNRVSYLSDNITTFRNFLKENKEYRMVRLQDEINKAIDICTLVLVDNGIKLINNIDYENRIELELVTGELPEVLINIINNAKDAIKEKFVPDPWIKIGLYGQDNKVFITVEDNAGGIPEDILPNIFNQYFTTKPEDMGTGLGLHMSKNIIENSLKGKLYAKNTQNGAKFIIELNRDTGDN